MLIIFASSLSDMIIHMSFPPLTFCGIEFSIYIYHSFVLVLSWFGSSSRVKMEKSTVGTIVKAGGAYAREKA